jgi:hypothetical protein
MAGDQSIIEQLNERMATRAEQQAPPLEEQDEADAAPTEPEADAEEAPETPEETLPTDLLSFGKAAGWDPEDIYGLTITLDTGDPVKLGEIKDKLQVYERERAHLAEQEQQLRSYAQQMQEQAQQFFSQRQADGAAAQEARKEMDLLEARYASVNWEELAKNDPGRAAYIQQQLAAEYAGAKLKYQEAQSKEQQAQQQYLDQERARHAQELLKAVPDWQDRTKLGAELPALQNYLGQWFRPEELDSIYDWRAMVIARKAFLYDQSQQKAVEATEKVKAAPKPVIRPGAPLLHGAAAQAREKALIKKARESRSQADKDAAAVAVLTRAFATPGKR